ncbi:MAG: hypothetical protein ACRD38_01820 [Nitrososphaerales archaeon]
MAGKFYLIGLIAGGVLIAIGAAVLFASPPPTPSEEERSAFESLLDPFIRGMMIIITGIVVLAFGIRFRALKM